MDGTAYRFHHIKMAGEAAAINTVAAEKFPVVLANIIEEGGFSPEWVGRQYNAGC